LSLVEQELRLFVDRNCRANSDRWDKHGPSLEKPRNESPLAHAINPFLK
jgi:hypothetical protein